MAEKKATQVGSKEQVVKVVLLDKHTHHGVEYKKGETITIRSSQLKKMQEWGKVK